MGKSMHGPTMKDIAMVGAKKPVYFNDAFYMDGFKDGKKDKERKW